MKRAIHIVFLLALLCSLVVGCQPAAEEEVAPPVTEKPVPSVEEEAVPSAEEEAVPPAEEEAVPPAEEEAPPSPAKVLNLYDSGFF